jgi:hypothetical protein
MSFQLHKTFQTAASSGLPPQLRNIYDSTIEGAYEEYTRKYGSKFEACSLEEAAAHEAGHCIALKAMGLDPLSATIECVRAHKQNDQITVWFGRTDCAANVAVGPNEDEKQVRLMAIKTLAGNVAEAEITGRTIPSSSIEEEALATIYVAWLTKMTGKTFKDEWDDVENRAAKLMNANKPVAVAISKYLIRRHNIRSGKLNKLLTDVDAWPIEDLGQLQPVDDELFQH